MAAYTLPGKRGTFSSRTFRLQRLISVPCHGPGGEDRLAAGDRAWALCDGASEGYDGAGWAAALSRALADHEDATLAVRVARSRYARSLALDHTVGDGKGGGAEGGGAEGGGAGSPDWLREHGLARGSWSTALIVRVSRLGSLARVRACGDSVLFVRDGFETVAAFPLDNADDFGLSPDLVADRGEELPPFRSAIVPLAALRHPVLVLATDALSERILRSQGEERRELWRFLSGAHARAVVDWASKEKVAGRLREDDLTLLEISP